MIRPSDLRVMIGMPAYKDIPWQTTRCLVETMGACVASSVPARLTFNAGSAVVTKARSDIVHAFLQSDCDRLFWIDSDMEWGVKHFFHLLGLSQHLPIVGATYPAKRDEFMYFVNCEGALPVSDLGCIAINGMGLGFTVMHREVVAAVANTKPWLFDGEKYLRDVFRIDRRDTGTLGVDGECPPDAVGQPIFEPLGEDMAFFADCRQSGYEVWMCPSIDLGHIGTKTYRGDLMAAMGLS